MLRNKTCILVVDDEVRILRLIKHLLEPEGYHVVTADNGQAALDMFDVESPDLVLMDILMPVMDGYTTCKSIREFSNIPIIVVTAKGKVEEIAQGLDSGADDYIVKPFSSKVLIARVKAVLRRSKTWEENFEPAFKCGELEMDFARHRVTMAGKELELTATEYKLLTFLVHNVGRLLTPDQILEAVWGEGYVGESHVLRVNIARLRQKLGDDPQNPRFVATRIGVGYVFLSPD
jgi:DNA-binding response OmpR family regulator